MTTQYNAFEIISLSIIALIYLILCVISFSKSES